jgi:hypothetical protein
MKLRQKPKTKKEKSAPDEWNEAYSADGVDLTLIRWMLSLTPEQRLNVLQQNIRSIERARGPKIHR